ncbi:MAG: tetratricopeptide repeat protein, partial [Mariniphaga sp.]
MKKYKKIGDKWVGRTVKFLTNSGLILFFLLGAVAGYGQSDRRIARWFSEARQLFAQQNYEQAIETCEKILGRDSGFVDAHLLLADIFHETQNIPAEIIHLKESVRQTKLPLVNWRLGNALFSLGNYNEALPWFQNYLNDGQLSARRLVEVNRKIESCIFAEKAIQKPVNFFPQRMPDAINSAFDEYWPSLSIDQKQLVFTRLIKKTGYQPQEDFYYSEFVEKKWQQAVPISDINTVENEGAQSLSADGKILFFTACNRPGGFGSCDIYYSFYSNGHWSKPYNAGQPVNTA